MILSSYMHHLPLFISMVHLMVSIFILAEFKLLNAKK